VSKLPAFFAAYPDMAVELAASESPTTIIEDGFDLAIHSGDLPDSTLVARRFAQTMTIVVATPQYLTRYGAPESPDDLNRFRSVVFVERGSVQPWSFGSGRDAKRLSPRESFEPAISNRCGWVSLNIWYCSGASMALRAELREGTVIRLLTAFERTVPMLAVRPASAVCLPKFAFSSSTWRRLSRSVPNQPTTQLNLLSLSRADRKRHLSTLLAKREGRRPSDACQSSCNQDNLGIH